METQDNLPVLSAIPAPAQDRSIRPPWKCFCCCDSGKVDNPYLNLFVQGVNGKPFICKRPDCEAGNKYRTAYYLSDAQRQEYAKKHGEVMTQNEYQAQWDIRLTTAHCEYMHQRHLADWNTRAAQRSKQLNYGQSISNLTQILSISNGKGL